MQARGGLVFITPDIPTLARQVFKPRDTLICIPILTSFNGKAKTVRTFLGLPYNISGAVIDTNRLRIPKLVTDSCKISLVIVEIH